MRRKSFARAKALPESVDVEQVADLIAAQPLDDERECFTSSMSMAPSPACLVGAQ
jgi:hypothetical protein